MPDEFISRTVYDTGLAGNTLRPYTTNLRVSTKSGEAPSISSVNWGNLTEGTAPTSVTPTVGTVAFTLQKSGAIVQVSDELLEDSAMNLGEVLTTAARDSSGRYLDTAILNGTGAYGGVLQAAIGSYTAANAASIVGADVIGLYYDLPANWIASDGCIFVTQSAVSAAISSINVSSAGAPAIASLNDSPSDWLMGKRHIMNDNASNGLNATIATTNVTALFGDFRQVYLFERNNVTISRDSSRFFDASQIAYKFEMRSGSKTAIPAAFTKLIQA